MERIVTGDRIVAYIDGGARGNPGPAGYGVRIETSAGTIVGELKGAIGVATNNVAEYWGLIAALTYLDKHGFRDVLIRSDSQLLTKQMRGEYRVRNQTLRTLYEQAMTLVGRVGHVEFEHVPREQNVAADQLANDAMNDAKTDAGDALDEVDRSIVKALSAGGSLPGSVLGLGLDVEEVTRVAQLFERYGDRFLSRIFTDTEAAYSRRRRFPAQHFTGRFAAKEAAMKALGTGHSQGVLWRDIEVVRVAGPPQLKFHGAAGRCFESMGAHRSLLTITHTRSLALAQVLLLAE